MHTLLGKMKEAELIRQAFFFSFPNQERYLNKQNVKFHCVGKDVYTYVWGGCGCVHVCPSDLKIT